MSAQTKLRYVGSRIMGGKSKSGADYDMATFSYIMPAEARMGKLQDFHEAVGLEVRQLSTTKEVFKSIKSLNLEPLSFVIVEMGANPNNLEQTILISVKPAPVERVDISRATEKKPVNSK